MEQVLEYQNVHKLLRAKQTVPAMEIKEKTLP